MKEANVTTYTIYRKKNLTTTVVTPYMMFLNLLVNTKCVEL